MRTAQKGEILTSVKLCKLTVDSKVSAFVFKKNFWLNTFSFNSFEHHSLYVRAFSGASFIYYYEILTIRFV